MRDVALLADNDVLLRAAHWDLLGIVPIMGGTDWSGVAVLPSLASRTRRTDPKLFKHAEVAKKLLPCLERCAPLPEPDPGLIDRLQGRIDIDVGEQILFACAGRAPTAQVLTGDKRAIRAVTELHLQQPLPELVGRVLCLEQFLWCALAELGADEMLRRVRQYAELDRGTLAIWGRIGEKSQAELEAGLESYARDVGGLPPSLLATRFGYGVASADLASDDTES